MIELDKKTFYSLIASTISVVGPFLLMVISAVLLSPDAFAENASNIYIMMLFAIVISLQIQNAVLRIDPLVDIRDDIARLAIVTIKRLAPGVILCAALFFALMPIQKVEYNFWAFFLLIIASIGYQAYQGFLNILIRRGAHKRQVFIQLLFFGVQIVLVSFLAYLVPASEWIRLASMLATIVLMFIFFSGLMRSYGTNVTSVNYLNEDVKRYTIWLIPLALSNFVLGYFDKIFASSTLAGEYAKEYLIISHIFSAFVILPTTINRLILPKIFDGRLSIDIMKTAKGFILFGVLTLIYLLVGGAIYAVAKFFFESTLDSIELIIIILIITQIARATYLILVTELHRQYRSANITIIAVVSAMSYVALVFRYHERGLIAICLCALAAQSLQTLGVIISIALGEKDELK